jgi:serine/threonine protein kinase
MELRREATVIASAADARRLGRYVLLGDIAEGGMGRIYLARAVGAAGFEKLFAIKVMHQGLADRNPDIGEMFLDEARINSLVRHPNVCAVHDFGDEAGVSFLVMEFMVGQTLLEVLRRAYTTEGVRDHPLFWARAARMPPSPVRAEATS